MANSNNTVMLYTRDSNLTYEGTVSTATGPPGSSVLIPGMFVEIDGYSLLKSEYTFSWGLDIRPSLIMIENAYKGADIDYEAAVGEHIIVKTALPGDILWAWQVEGYYSTYGETMRLEYGLVKPLSVPVDPWELAQSFCISMEAVDTTTSGMKRIKVMIIH